MKLWIITGSATDDGAPIYLQTGARWTRTLSAAEPVADDQPQHKLALLEAARAQQRIVCDPYPMEVRRGSDGELAPISLREKIRAEGPTILRVGAPTSRPTAVSA
ncbi:hypothetical protein ENSA5_07520 [Enhygromyxa salina]|uniref:DUF2849 domain-containing protein n=1 Tax=Enhygromyxa salina TaxID=215803 RepID=A0A2S9YHK4_9BACT|nr:DUF2849 domain-containing protein [Enhygromyxa salina]PRQ04521.1 hypothetical protein ENSA5_07520 [Enhygromyxa salina]